MDPRERVALLHALSELTREDPLLDPANMRRRRFFLFLSAGCCLWLVPWIVLLAFTLPQHHTAGQWSAAWTGFDVALLLAIAGTALAVWRRLQLAVGGMVITATLLTCDAWFDVMLSWGSGEFAWSVVTALLGELPLAGLCFFVAQRLIRLTVHAVWVRGGFGDIEPPLSHMRIFTLDETAQRPAKQARDHETP